MPNFKVFSSRAVDAPLLVRQFDNCNDDLIHLTLVISPVESIFLKIAISTFSRLSWMFFVEQTVSRSDRLSVTHSIVISLCSQRSKSVSNLRIQSKSMFLLLLLKPDIQLLMYSSQHGVFYEIASEWEKLFHQDCTTVQ